MRMVYDVVVVGGGPAGLVSAITVRKYYPDKRIVLIRDVEKGVIPCAIPYVFKTLDSVDKDILPDKPLEANKIDKIIAKVVKIDRNIKEVILHNGDHVKYEKLILAVGSLPVVPHIPGVDKKGIYTIKKDIEYLRMLREEIYKSKNVVIVGGGFIGAEFADELSKIEGLNISIVEVLPHILCQAFDDEFCTLAEERLKEKGVKVYTNTKVVEFTGADTVEGVKLSTGEVLDADLVILSVGARPNTHLAEEAGLWIGRGGGIWVDEYMRTSDPDIFAVGDCAEKRCFFTRRHTPVMLASTATAEARIVGANLYALKVIRENKGTIANFSTYINGLTLAAAGLTEKRARQEGYDIVVGVAKGVNRHPGSMPGARDVIVKLIFSRYSGILLGGQVAGGESAGEIINIISLAIQKRALAVELETLQMATHPWLTPAPTVYPIVNAAMDAVSKNESVNPERAG